MSMEQAILEHAGALRELAAAIKSMGGMGNIVRVEHTPVGVFGVPGNDKPYPEDANSTSTALIEDKSAELAAARTERVDDDHLAISMDSVDLVEGWCKAVRAETEQAEQAALDYKKDVYPVLLQVSKTKGKEALRGLLDKFGAKTGDSLKADQFAAIVADGNALLAA